jgi:hypothetical protein
MGSVSWVMIVVAREGKYGRGVRGQGKVGEEMVALNERGCREREEINGEREQDSSG